MSDLVPTRWLVGASVLGVAAAAWLAPGTAARAAASGVVVALGLGLACRAAWPRRPRVASGHAADALDLLAEAAHAGLSAPSAMAWAAASLAGTPNPLRTALAATAAGPDPDERWALAAERLASHAPTPTLWKAAFALDEAERRGVPAREALPRVARALRPSRLDAALDAAGAAGMRITGVVLALLLPPILAVLVVPAVLVQLGAA